MHARLGRCTLPPMATLLDGEDRTSERRSPPHRPRARTTESPSLPPCLPLGRSASPRPAGARCHPGSLWEEHSLSGRGLGCAPENCRLSATSLLRRAKNHHRRPGNSAAIFTNAATHRTARMREAPSAHACRVPVGLGSPAVPCALPSASASPLSHWRSRMGVARTRDVLGLHVRFSATLENRRRGGRREVRWDGHATIRHSRTRHDRLRPISTSDPGLSFRAQGRVKTRQDRTGEDRTIGGSVDGA